MSYITLVFLVLSGLPVQAMEVVQFADEPMVESNLSRGQIQFFGKVSTLSQWRASDLADLIPMDSSPQHTALVNSLVEGSSEPLSREQMESLLGEDLGGEFYHFYSNKSEDYLERQQSRNFAPLSASIFEFKQIASVGTAPADLRAQLMEGLQLLQRVDPDHDHELVDADFASSVLPEVHSGHNNLQEMPADTDVLLSAVRAGEYGCPVMEKAIGLLLRVTWESLPSYQGRKLANLYTMSLYRELKGSELDEVAQIFGRRPEYAFSQEVFYAPQVLKDAHHIWAVFSNQSGGSQLAAYSVIATSTKAANQALSMALDGVTEVTIYETSQEAGKQVAVDVAESVLDAILGGAEEPAASSETSRFPMTLTRDRVDLSVGQGESRCYKGLAKGLPWFVLDMFSEMVRD